MLALTAARTAYFGDPARKIQLTSIRFGRSRFRVAAPAPPVEVVANDYQPRYQGQVVLLAFPGSGTRTAGRGGQ